jgi:polysaccharide deacetylase family protein (PEP-CTERM system associated)
MKNILTIDLEDWYQGIELPLCEWSKCEDRVERSVRLLLEILDESETKATFFVLGYVAEKFPRLVREIAELGHEIGTHGYGHELVYKLTPAQFASDLKRSIDILEQTIGNPIKIYRAPYFSITEKSIWAMEILTEHGIEYDSSIFPIKNYRYGIPDALRYPHNVQTQNGALLEIPISTITIFGRNLSLTGGVYLRFFPYYLIEQAIQRINREGHYSVVYLHPWELDPDHPKLKLPLRIKLTHYHNLVNTEKKLRALLKDFDFAPAINVAVRKNNLSSIRYLSSTSAISEKSRRLWEFLD